MQSSSPRASTQPVWVFDSTALVNWFKSGSPFTFTSLERLHAEQPIAIPDMVLFEMTDYLPNYQHTLVDALTIAKEDGAEALEACIKKHTRQSPFAKSDRNKASQIEVLLRFIAHYPDTLKSTHVGRHYGRYTNVQIALPPSDEPDETQETTPPGNAYMLTKGDAAHLTNGVFNVRPLRVHISDLLQMGYMKTNEYVRLEGKQEKASSVRKRFVTSSDFLQRLNPSPHSSTLAALENVLVPKTGKTKRYLTFGDLETKVNNKRSLLPERDKLNFVFSDLPTERIPLDEMVEHTGLLVEHLFYGGILPEALVPTCAHAMGFSAEGDEAYPETKGTLGETLKQEGFFERRVTIGLIKQLKPVLEGINASEIEGVEASEISRSIECLTQLSDVKTLSTHRRDVLSECTKNRSTSTTGEKEFDPERGTAYEHVFTDALLSGMVSAGEFVALAQNAGALPNKESFGNEGELCGLSNGSLFFHSDENLLLIERPLTRAGTVEPMKERDGLNPRQFTINDRHYVAYPIDTLLEIATSHTDPYAKTCRRYFRAMLYPAIAEDAMGFREKAQKYFASIGKDALLPQLEHHWLRMHKRYWGGAENMNATSAENPNGKRGLPFFTSPFASLYAQRDTVKKNLGETAAAEVAHELAQGGHSVAIINNDKALMWEAESRKFKGFHSEHRRHMSRFRNPSPASGAFDLITLENAMKQSDIRVLPSKELIQRVKALQDAPHALPDATEHIDNAANFVVSDIVAMDTIELGSANIRLAS